MKARVQADTRLHSAVTQLRHVARKKRVQSLNGSRDKATLLQEARQVDEAVRLLRWIRE